jgi:hypothetical protein
MSDNEHLPILSSVVLLRLIDYAKRPVAEQARLNAQLDTMLAMLLPDMPEKTYIVLSGAGSAAVAFLNSPLAALTFAERTLRANHVGLGLCIGIDHGPVEVVSSESGDMLAGDGMATASVIAAFSTVPGLLASQNFRTALAQMSPGAETALVPTANFSDAGLRTYKVFCLDPLAPGRRKRRLFIVAISLVILLLASATAIRFGIPDRPQPLASLFDTPAPPEIVAPECPKVEDLCPKIEPTKPKHPKKTPYGNFWKNWK